MNKNCLFLILTLLFFLQSCKNEESTFEIYDRNAIDLLSHIVENEDLICSCVVQVDSLSLYDKTISDILSQGSQFKNKIIEVLNIKNQTEFEKFISMGQNFRFKSEMFDGRLKIIEREEVPRQFESLKTERGQKFIRKCPNFNCWISKPIFNENFTKAIIYNTYGTNCFYIPPSVYFKFRGKWEIAGESDYFKF